MDEARPGRRGAGRRRIEIKRIPNQKKRWVTFSKRKKGLLSKAARLSSITGEDIGVVIISEQGRFYISDNADAVIDRYLSIETGKDNNGDGRNQGIVEDDNNYDGDGLDDGVTLRLFPQEIGQDDDHNDDGRFGNGIVMDKQGLNLNRWDNVWKINDGEIKGENCFMDLNKPPHDDDGDDGAAADDTMIPFL
ncbi:hypothetical protein ERO13_D05G331820v2 [Gossypium hirsutum]|uniref:Pheromone receptor transcription factor n=3 Tax=Gossypium TaxID=3633 RepID=A0A1U8J2H1_GOSHI|nr:pheromone receptor transcription factor-like [Gossypium hirsutum]KAB2032241.1 hypothetical protein ES319_D05G358800v1 [Gossypium barbadense]KAG4149349.1 hypothetical protein ERO13_D05G331820v2 [Gossypium hirsutum]PPD99386.1 hypothetical protein GOBAR_DD03588 [Gossypium barbadense]TYG71272.1 hypothetical protein ES288_D05G382200v1 [Gossypium darwinii]